jgi:uncharacterized protein (DUF1501 family)
MKRRSFIKRSSLASGYFLIPGFLKPLEALALPDEQERNVVIIQLSGGNDGLNTIVPFRNDLYYQKRPNVGIKGDKVSVLDNDLAFNNALLPLKTFYDNGEMTIINGVGYPNPDRSHFRSMDIWHTGSKSSEYLKSGWIGRYLDANCKNSHQAIEVDQQLSLALKGKVLNGLAVKDAKQLFNQMNETYFKAVIDATKEKNLTETNQGYLYKTLLQTESSAAYIYNTSKIYTNSFTYPNTEFSKQLKNVATFIHSGVKSKVYYLSLGGFDTHVNQVGRHNKLLEQYAEGVTAFINDLKQQKRFKDTTIFTFSEFGRRVEENAGGGTDHGTANVCFLFGTQLKKKKMFNLASDLSVLDEGDLVHSVDFRSIYKSILESWLNVSADGILAKDVESLNLF